MPRNAPPRAFIDLDVPVDYIIDHPRSLAPATEMQGHLTIFCDGSRLRDSSGGAGIAYSIDGKWSGKIIAIRCDISDASIAETAAIYEALSTANELMPGKYRQLTIYSDSRSALHAIKRTRDLKGRAQSALDLEIFKLEQNLIKQYIEITYSWVKAHHICLGNKIADNLAGRASRLSRERRQARGAGPGVHLRHQQAGAGEQAARQRRLGRGKAAEEIASAGGLETYKNQRNPSKKEKRREGRRAKHAHQ